MKKESDPPKVGYERPRGAPREPSDTAAQLAGKPPSQDYLAHDSSLAQDRGSVDALSDLIGLLWLRIRVVGVVALFFGATFCLYTCTQESIFESSAEINLLPEAAVPNVAEGSRTSTQNAIHVTGEMRVLSSSGMTGRFIDSLQASDLSQISVCRSGLSAPLIQVLGRVRAVTSSLVERLVPRQTSGTLNRVQEAGFQQREEQAGVLNKKRMTEAFRKALSVGVPRGTARENGIVEVNLRSNRPESAQRMLMAYLDFYDRVMRSQRRADLEAQRSALKEQLAKADQTLLQSERSLAEFAHVNGIISENDNAISPFLSLVNKSVERIVEAREEKERIRSMPQPGAGLTTTTSGRTEEGGFVAALRQQLAALEMQYAEWKTVYSSDFPKMIQLDKKIAFLRQKVDGISRKAADAGLESASREEKVVEKTLDASRRDAARMNSLQIRYSALKKKAASDNQVCQKLLGALADLDIRSGTGPAGMAIIEPPTLPSVPIAPKRWRTIILGVALGLLCGVAVAFVLESVASSQKVLDIEKMAAGIKTRSLGIVPDFTTFDDTEGRSRNRNHSESLPPDTSTNVVTHILRDIESALFFTYCENPWKITIVSSAISQEGKTFIASSLSSALSVREGQRTLVIDADMRKPRLHEVFGHKEPGPGLSTLLTDKKAVLSHLIRRSQYPGLCYITAGPVPTDPLLLLRSRRFGQLLSTLERYFHNIVIDSPPILSVPDYMPLCHLVKSVILVVKEGETLREEVRKSAELIRSIPGTHILGLILNRAQMTASRYGSSACHRSQYHYRYHERYYRRVS